MGKLCETAKAIPVDRNAFALLSDRKSSSFDHKKSSSNRQALHALLGLCIERTWSQLCYKTPLTHALKGNFCSVILTVKTFFFTCNMLK